MFDFTPVSSWVENFNESTQNESSRLRIFESFVMLPEVEESARIILDRIHRKQGRGFFITGLYGSGKTIFMAWLSAILTDPVLCKKLLDSKPEWKLDDLASKKFLTINFTAIEIQDLTLEEALWQSVTKHLRSLSPPVNDTLSNTEAYLEQFDLLSPGIKTDIDSWLQDHKSTSIASLATYDANYQKSIIEDAITALGLALDDVQTTTVEKVKKLVDIAKSRGFEGVHIFIDELYLHLIQSDDHFKKGTAFLGQLAEAGLAGDQPFWIFGAVQEEIQAIARQAGRTYDTELMGKLSGQAGRFQSINIPVTQFHRIYNHRLFRANSKKIHVLADSFTNELQPHYRGTFTEFFKRYFRGKEPVTDEAKHFAEVYPMHPFALYCLTVITNRGGRSRGALGFVQEFIEHHNETDTDWKRLAVLDDVFDYEDLRNKIISDDPDMQKYYSLYERFCSTVRDEVLARTPYRRWDDAEKKFAKIASERLIKALIVLSMVKEELDISKINDALLLRWPGHESDPAASDAESIKLLDKITNSFSPLRRKGSEGAPTFFLSMEGDGGEREELLVEVERVVNGFGEDIQTESAYRSHLELFLHFPGSPLGGTIPPGHGFASEIDKIDWQRTMRSFDYRLEPVNALTGDHQVSNFIKDVPSTKALHIAILYPSISPLDVEMDQVRQGNPRTLIWLPATLPVQDVDEIRRSMALVKLYGDYKSQINAGGASESIRRKYDLLKEELDIPAGQTDVQPKKSVIERLQSAFIEGEIRQWNSSDEVWEILCEPAALLGYYNSINQNERSLANLLKKVGGIALSKVFHLHPDFKDAYSFTADISNVIRKRVLAAIWKGLVTDNDGSGKTDLEKYLAPLGVLNTTIPGEVSVTLNAGSVEAFRKAKERIKDNIRKSGNHSISVSDTRKRLKTSDMGLTDTWADILITLLIGTGEITGYTIDGKVVSQDDRSSVGDPVDWLQTLDELRPGTRPDEVLWHDLIQGMTILGLWKDGDTYTPTAAERLLEALKQAEEESQYEFKTAEQALDTWTQAGVPESLAEWADLFALPPESRESRIACFKAVRDAMLDMFGLAADDDIEAANRYTCIEDFSTRLRKDRDFIDRVGDLSKVTARLRDLQDLGLPNSINTNSNSLLKKIETYILSSGNDGELSTIIAEWKDLKEQYVSQYISEHSGVHRDLKSLQDMVLNSDNYALLQNLSQVEGLSAHYSPVEIEKQLKQLLRKVQVSQVCEREIADLQGDLENRWICSECGYKPGNKEKLESDKYLELIQLGIKEYFDLIHGCADDIKDYVAEYEKAKPLLGLLTDPITEEAIASLFNEKTRNQLAEALVDASATKINVDDLLKKLKPQLLGFFKYGRKDFESCVIKAMTHLLEHEDIAKDDQPWKVE